MFSLNGKSFASTAAMLRRANTARVLQVLRQAGQISRADLARQTALDPKTITNLINELLEAGLVACGDTVVSGRGRPAEKISIHSDAAFSIGLDLGVQQISGVVLDLRGQVRHQWREEYGAPRDRAFLLARAERAIAELIRMLGAPRVKLLEGIGFCVPGFLNRKAGVAVQSVNIRGFSNVAIAQPFSRRFGLPVALEEASRAKALAELWFGHHKPADHLICLDIGFGIGMGIIHQGVLYRGTHESSGEIGHTVVQFNGMLCRCGKRGCLETVASGRALHDVARRLSLGSKRGGSVGARAIYEAAVAGSERARKVLRQTGEFLGMAIANVANLLDPDLVVLSGGLVDAGPLLVEPLRKAVAAYQIGPHAAPLQVKVSELGPLSGAMGVATLPLRHFFETDGPLSDGESGPDFAQEGSRRNRSKPPQTRQRRRAVRKMGA